jgi:Cu-Zn family superoxide dismutase
MSRDPSSPSPILPVLFLGAMAALAVAVQESHGAPESPWGDVKELVCVLEPTAGNSCKGTVRFTEVEGGVKVVADLEGLTANQQHGFHVHEFGDCTSSDGESAGGHYDPEGHPHGDPAKADPRHASDLGNVEADASGKAHHEVTVKNVTLVGDRNPILGRAVIVHAKPDDFGQPTGNAGARLCCGVIGVAKPRPKS